MLKRVLMVVPLPLAILLVSSGCAPVEPAVYGVPSFDIVVENQTDQVLTIYEERFSRGEVAPKGQIAFEGVGGEWLITAENAHGEEVFSEVFTFKTNLIQIDRRTYKAVIPPLK
jgi:hypothetical protein